MSHFKTTRKGITAKFSPEERVFLGDVLPLLAAVGVNSEDPASDRLNVPVYLDDPDANEEWWRLMGEDLKSARSSDRTAFEKAISEDAPALSEEDANAVMRVLNEARLVLGARMGVEVEGDHENLPEDSRQVLDYLGWIQEELVVELSKGL